MLALLLACAPASPNERPPGPRADDPDPTVLSGTAEPRPPARGDALSVCINELMAASLASAPEDWLELHNPTAEDVSLDGWSLTDDPTEPRRHELDGLVLGAGGFLVLWASDLSFALPEDGGAIGLFDPDGDGSVVQLGPMVPDLSLARTADCCFDAAGGCFTYEFAGTPGASNAR